MADSLQTLMSRDRVSPRSPRAWQSEAGSWLFNLGLLVFIGSLVLAGGLFVYKNSLAKSQATWADQVKSQEDDLRPDLLSQLINLSHELSATRGLLANHTFTSNVFAFLESITLPHVQFTNFTFSAQNVKIDLAAVADSFQTVADQVQILESNPQVEKVDFGGLNRSQQGKVNFRMTITVKPSLLRLAALTP